MEITKYDIQEIILDGNNETFFNIASNLGPERIKCNADSDELASIHWAASARNTEVLEYLLSDEVKESANLLRANNFSPLHAAAMNGQTRTVEVLIKMGADVNVQTDPQKYAPIHSAAFGGHLETVKVLVESGADLQLKNYRDELTIDTAKRQNQVEVIAYLEHLK